MPKISDKTITSVDPKDLEMGSNVPSFQASEGEETSIQAFMKKRVFDLKDYRTRALPGSGTGIETIWADADREFAPHELSFPGGGTGRRVETDDELGLRGRMVTIGQEDMWQSSKADPMFYVKVSTAVGILIDQNPEAVFISASSKYEANRSLAYANWKQSWEKGNAKQQLKLFTFNLAKYGTAYAKTVPKLVDMQKTVVTAMDPADPSKNKTEVRRLVKFNDLFRKNLNPWQVWLSEGALPGDHSSIDDWYHEENYSWDRFQEEFKDFANIKYVSRNAFMKNDRSGQTGTNTTATAEPTKDTVTVGFYENQIKDKYVIWIPSQDIPLYYSPLPNDDGMLSLWTAPWTLRHDECHFGIGIYEIIRQDVELYDRFKNMTMDQLTLSIYKMFFHKGTDQLGQNGNLTIVAGKGEQVADPKNITFLEVPGPGQDAWKGLSFLQDSANTNSGVPMQLTGKFAGNTLGQDVQAKEMALQRLKMPLDFIIDALQQEAYVSLSWQKQILSTPEILEWASPEELEKALKEFNLSDADIQSYMAEIQNPQTQVLSRDQETGMGSAYVYPEVSVGIEKTEGGELMESEKNRFYRFGLHLPTGALDWKGIVRIKPQSVLSPSKDLEKRSDLDLYNLVFPSIQAMAANPMMVPVLMPPIKQIIKIFEKDIKDWIDEAYFMKLFQDASAPKPAPEPEVKSSLSISFQDITPLLTPVQQQIVEKYLGVKIEQPLFIDKTNPESAMPGATAMPGTPQSPMAMGAAGGEGGEGDGRPMAQGVEPIANIGKAARSTSDQFQRILQ